MPGLGERWVLVVEDLADGCSYPAAATQSGPRGEGVRGAMQRGMMSGAGGGRT